MKVRLPRAHGAEENFEIVSVNSRRDKLMKGVDVELGLSQALVLLQRQHAERAAEAYLERVSAL